MHQFDCMFVVLEMHAYQHIAVCLLATLKADLYCFPIPVVDARHQSLSDLLRVSHATPFIATAHPFYCFRPRQNCVYNMVDLFTIPFGAAALVLPWRLPIALTAYASTSTESHEFDAQRRAAFVRVSAKSG